MRGEGRGNFAGSSLAQDWPVLPGQRRAGRQRRAWRWSTRHPRALTCLSRILRLFPQELIGRAAQAKPSTGASSLSSPNREEAPVLPHRLLAFADAAAHNDRHGDPQSSGAGDVDRIDPDVKLFLRRLRNHVALSLPKQTTILLFARLNHGC